MTAFQAWRGGLRRAGRASSLLLLLWICSLLVVVPPAVLLNGEIERHLDSSLEADAAADGVNSDWLQEFRAQAGPIGKTLRPAVIGFAAVVDNASALADVSFGSIVVVVCGLVFAGLVWFLSPALICRVAANRPLDTGPLLAVCGSFFPRMVRLGVVSFGVYGALFASVHPWLFGDLFDRVTREMTVERTAFVVRLFLYVVFFSMVAGVNMLFDYARVRLVVEDRRSVIAAVAAASRFIRKNAGVAVGVYALNVASFAVATGAYALLAPGAGSAGWSAWGAFLIGQIYVAARLAVKLAFWATETTAVQGRFGCPGFVRAIGPARPA